MTWDDLDFWKSKEWQTITDRLDQMDKEGEFYNPEREKLFAALDVTPLNEVSVVLLGQDPYPNYKHCTGIAFHTGTADIPPTLRMIHEELKFDYHYELPNHGSLAKWYKQGVLLWNAIPTCYSGLSASHRSWGEWDKLTKEIITKVSDKGECVFVLMGSFAHEFESNINDDTNFVIRTSHPSPLSSYRSWHPFKGSRIFSTTNGYLNQMGKPLIDWRL